MVGQLPFKPWRMLSFRDFQDILQNEVRGENTKYVMRDKVEFMVGSIGLCETFWEQEILKHHPDKELLISWVKGVKIETFFNPFTRDNYKAVKIESRLPPKIKLENYVPDEFTSWVTRTIEDYKRIKMLVPWEKVRRTEENKWPELILPLGVEPSKPRLLWDARYLNLFLKHCPFMLDGLEKASSIGWERMHLFKIDHKAGYLQVPFHRDSWKYLGVEWNKEVLVFTCLAFGGSFCPVIYHSLSDATSRYIRRLDIPMLTYIDDMAGGTLSQDKHKRPDQQLVTARKACFITTLVLFCAEYFLNKKCVFEPTTKLTYLGIECDTENLMFWIPHEKIKKLVALIKEILEKGISNFVELEKVVGKCRSMSIAVPAAILYTRTQYAILKNEERPHKRGLSRNIVITEELREELNIWLQLGTK